MSFWAIVELLFAFLCRPSVDVKINVTSHVSITVPPGAVKDDSEKPAEST